MLQEHTFQDAIHGIVDQGAVHGVMETRQKLREQCSRALFRRGCGDAWVPERKRTQSLGRSGARGTVLPHRPPEAPGHGKLYGGRNTASLKEETCLLTKHKHCRAGSQPDVTQC